MFKKITLSISILFIFHVITIFGQKEKSTFIVYELSPLIEHSTLTADDNYSYVGGPRAGVPCFLIAQEIIDHLFIESGIVTRYTGRDFVLFEDSLLFCTHHNAIQVPLRASYRFSLFNNKLHLFPSIGINYNILSDKLSIDDLNLPSNIKANGKFFSDTWGYDLGIGADLFVHRNFSIGVAYRFMKSFKDVANFNILKIDEAEPIQTCNIRDKGVAHGVFLRFQYKISSFWNKKEVK